MIKRPLIVGAKGSIGRRYTAIMREWFCEPLTMDLGDDVPEGFDGVLICTPTDDHVARIQQFLPYGKPILCEKAISKDVGEVEAVLAEAEAAGVRLDMVNQYRFCAIDKALPPTDDLTYLNYFNHGKDGLAWDCISIIGLARGKVVLQENSSRWYCSINGWRVLIQDMDSAYAKMIAKWMHGELVGHGPEYIRHAHAQVVAYLEGRL